MFPTAQVYKTNNSIYVACKIGHFSFVPLYRLFVYLYVCLFYLSRNLILDADADHWWHAHKKARMLKRSLQGAG